MNKSWERSIPFYQIDGQTANHLFSYFDSKLRVASISPLLEGCRNTNYVVQMHNSDATFLLRIFPINDDSWKKEKNLLSTLKSEIPVQQLYFISQDDSIESKTYAIYEFLKGITLESTIHSGYIPNNQLMSDIGKVLALIHKHTYTKVGFINESLEVKDILPPFETWYEMFLGKNARMRLGRNLVNKIERIVSLNKDYLKDISKQISLVHGDFRPTNILIHNGKLRCILDWEFAMAGHPLADIGQLFRREEYFVENLRREFEKAYLEESVVKIPDNWYQLSKLRDLVNLLQMINAEGDLPQKYMDVKCLISQIAYNYGL